MTIRGGGEASKEKERIKHRLFSKELVLNKKENEDETPDFWFFCSCSAEHDLGVVRTNGGR
jgi:hypothetical protein